MGIGAQWDQSEDRRGKFERRPAGMKDRRGT